LGLRQRDREGNSPTQQIKPKDMNKNETLKITAMEMDKYNP